MQSCSFQKDLQILSHTVSDKTYIFRFIFKKYNKNSKIPFLSKNMGHKKTFRWKIICLNGVYIFSSRHLERMCILCFDYKKHY